jgi:hypothetical protein
MRNSPARSTLSRATVVFSVAVSSRYRGREGAAAPLLVDNPVDKGCIVCEVLPFLSTAF